MPNSSSKKGSNTWIYIIIAIIILIIIAVLIWYFWPNITGSTSSTTPATTPSTTPSTTPITTPSTTPTTTPATPAPTTPATPTPTPILPTTPQPAPTGPSLAGCNINACNGTMQDWIVNKYWAFNDSANTFATCNYCQSRWFKAPLATSTDGINWKTNTSRQTAYDSVALS